MVKTYIIRPILRMICDSIFLFLRTLQNTSKNTSFNTYFKIIKSCKKQKHHRLLQGR